MRITKIAMALAILGLWSSQHATAADFDAYYYQGGQPASPSDQAPPMPMGEAAAAPAVEGASCGCGEAAEDDGCGCRKCCNSFCGFERCCELDCGDWETVHLFDDICGLKRRGITITGWIDAGITANGEDPVDNYNGPVTFGDRTEGQLNQLYLVTEKAIDNDGCGWDVGGRIDLVYGTDYRFTMARGLETRDDFSPKWNSGRFYGLAMPQAYLDVAYNDTTVRLGHFYTIIGYEVVPAPNNFFYSHAYTMQYAEPFTHTGMLVMQKWNDRLSFSAGFHRGWDNFEDYPGNDQLDFLGGVTIASEDGKGSLAFAITSGEEASAVGFAPRTMYSIVYSRKMLCDRFTYVLQHDLGVQNDGVGAVGAAPITEAQWYGINQYFLYQLNCCWSAGMRVEWFRDDDGTRVTGVGDGNAIAGAAFEGNFWEITWGLNWKPNPNVTIRPELRYDWFDGTGNPYNDGTDNNQFTAAVDAIIQW